MSTVATRRVPTLASQILYWGDPPRLVPKWLPLTVDTRDATREQVIAALALVVARHEGLRAVPERDSGGTWQHIYDPVDVPIKLYDIAAEDAAWREIDTIKWPIEQPRWIAGMLVPPVGKLVLKVCHGVTDQVGLRILAGDLAQALAAVREGVAPSWRPAASLARIAQAEATPEGQNTLRRNGDYFRRMFAPGWIMKPIPERVGEHDWLRASVVVDETTMSAFMKASAAMRISWHSVLRAALVLAEETVQASGRVRLVTLHHGRGDDERRRCLGNFAVQLSMLLDASDALWLDREEWARRVDAVFEESAAHLPIPQTKLFAWDTLSEHLFGRFPERIPNYEFETAQAPTTYLKYLPPGSGDRLGAARVLAEWDGRRPLSAMMCRFPGEVLFTLTDHSARCAPESLNLIATCWLAAIQSYAGLTGTAAQETWERASALRRAVGPASVLSEVDGALVAVSAARPAAMLPRTTEQHEAA